MGKSAQFPLHVWLPDSMEGPTPISALIHAATMVTAGIFMVARMSPLFELTETALSFILVIGGITTLFMALVAIVQNDIKRVVAYSTLSQLGYMTIALEGYAAMLEERTRLDELSVDLQLLVSVVGAFEPDDYVLAQRVRGALRRETQALFQEVDLLALPSTGGPPPKVSESEEASGFVDPLALDDASRYVYVASLCGTPAGTAPVGFDALGLPVGLQLLGDAWDEASVLQALAHLERIGAARVTPAPAYQELLGI